MRTAARAAGAGPRELIRRGLLPRPSYVLDDGAEMVPRNYFALADAAGGAERLHGEFERRYRAVAGANLGELAEDWEGYLSGVYGVCLREVTPETIVRKGILVSALTPLLAMPRADDPDWRRAVREHVDELDSLEREFAPDYDRNVERFGRPPTRDLLIKAARERFPDVFS
jgi:hypothetical protein